MDTKALKLEMKRAGLTQTMVAKELNMSSQAVSNKINGKSPITVDEAVVISRMLNLNPLRRSQIFLL